MAILLFRVLFLLAVLASLVSFSRLHGDSFIQGIRSALNTLTQFTIVSVAFMAILLFRGMAIGRRRALRRPRLVSVAFMAILLFRATAVTTADAAYRTARFSRLHGDSFIQGNAGFMGVPDESAPRFSRLRGDSFIQGVEDLREEFENEEVSVAFVAILLFRVRLGPKKKSASSRRAMFQSPSWRFFYLGGQVCHSGWRRVRR